MSSTMINCHVLPELGPYEGKFSESWYLFCWYVARKPRPLISESVMNKISSEDQLDFRILGGLSLLQYLKVVWKTFKILI